MLHFMALIKKDNKQICRLFNDIENSIVDMSEMDVVALIKNGRLIRNACVIGNLISGFTHQEGDSVIYSFKIEGNKATVYRTVVSENNRIYEFYMDRNAVELLDKSFTVVRNKDKDTYKIVSISGKVKEAWSIRDLFILNSRAMHGSHPWTDVSSKEEIDEINYKLALVGEGYAISYNRVPVTIDTAVIKSINITRACHYIPPRKFMEYKTIKEVKLGGTVKIIGEKAFSGCTGIEHLTILDGVDRIKHGAFQNCKHISKVILPKSLELIEDYAFNETIIDELTITNEDMEIGNNVFKPSEDMKVTAPRKIIKELLGSMVVKPENATIVEQVEK